MNFTELTKDIPREIKQTINRIIKDQKKLSKCESAIQFNSRCLEEDILPKYSNLKLHDRATSTQGVAAGLSKILK